MANADQRVVQIFDTSLRDGEQVPEGGRVNYTAGQKIRGYDNFSELTTNMSFPPLDGTRGKLRR